MKRLQAYKFKIEPNGEQIRNMRQFAGNARKVWNLAVARQQANHAAGEKFTNAFGMNNWLPEWKKEFLFLRESPAQTLQQVMADLDRGYKNFFEKIMNNPDSKTTFELFIASLIKAIDETNLKQIEENDYLIKKWETKLYDYIDEQFNSKSK